MVSKSKKILALLINSSLRSFSSLHLFLSHLFFSHLRFIAMATPTSSANSADKPFGHQSNPSIHSHRAQPWQNELWCVEKDHWNTLVSPLESLIIFTYSSNWENMERSWCTSQEKRSASVRKANLHQMTWKIQNLSRRAQLLHRKKKLGVTIM